MKKATLRYSLFFTIFSVAILQRFVHPGDLYISYFTDDFYYYYKISDNLIKSGISSFNGIHLTNGYHPLWMLIIATIQFITGGGALAFIGISLVICCLVTATYILYDKISIFIYGDYAHVWITSALSAIFIGVLAKGGMEIPLAAFFIALFFFRCLKSPLENQSIAELLITGFIASIVFLSRIDAIIPIFIYIATTFINKKIPIIKIIFISLGASLIAIYVAINIFIFETILPISGMAKQLKTTYIPSLRPLKTITSPGLLNIFYTWPAIIVAILAAFKLKNSILTGNEKAVVVSLLLHPVILFSILCVKSDWPTWIWYQYPFATFFCIAAPILINENNIKNIYKKQIKQMLPLAAFSFSIFGFIGVARTNSDAMAIYNAANAIQQFSITHPGIYGMGDRAGMPGYFLNYSVIQLEGLTENKQFLQKIQTSENLLSVLKEMRVNYYITTNPKHENDCYVTREPVQAGPASPVMRGKFCAPPIARFKFGGEETLIFSIVTN